MVFLAGARRLLADLTARPSAAIKGTAGAPSGHLRLTAPLTFGRMHLMPVLAAFLREQPQLTASLTTLDRVANLIEEGFDAAVRIAQLPDSGIVARRIGEVRRLLIASPDYLHAHGTPPAPEVLADHDVVAFQGSFPGGHWRFVRDGKPQSVDVRARLTVNDALAAIAAAERGEGITGALSYMVAPQLAAGTLVAVLAELSPPAVPVQIVYPQNRLVAHQGPRLRRLRGAPPRPAAAVRFRSPRRRPECCRSAGPRRDAPRPEAVPAGHRARPGAPGTSACRNCT